MLDNKLFLLMIITKISGGIDRAKQFTGFDNRLHQEIHYYNRSVVDSTNTMYIKIQSSLQKK